MCPEHLAFLLTRPPVPVPVSVSPSLVLVQTINNIGSTFRIAGHIRSSLEHYLEALGEMRGVEGAVDQRPQQDTALVAAAAETSSLELYTLGTYSCRSRSFCSIVCMLAWLSLLVCLSSFRPACVQLRA
jgi:hypothetical protein